MKVNVVERSKLLDERVRLEGLGDLRRKIQPQIEVIHRGI